jgi:hypothetical protein
LVSRKRQKAVPDAGWFRIRVKSGSGTGFAGGQIYSSMREQGKKRGPFGPLLIRKFFVKRLLADDVFH